MLQKINAHGHLLPEPHQIPAFMRKARLFWIDEDKSYMRQGDWSRPITAPSFFLEAKREWMAEHGIEHSVILTLSQLYGNGWNQQQVKDALTFQNDFNAGVQADYRKEFTTGFVVQPRFIEWSLQEIERCVEQHDMQLLCLPTHYLNAQEQWTSVADSDVEPIWELANRYGLAVEIHPYDGQRFIALKDQHWRFHLVWMMAQTADTLHAYTLGGFSQRYPKVRTCFAHGCMLGQANYGRRMQGYLGRPDLFEGTESPEASLGHPNLFFDTLVHDVWTLQLLLKRCGSAQVVAGLDDPYPLGEMENVPNSYPGKVLDDAVREQLITTEEQQAIWRDNVWRWLGTSTIR